MPNIILIVLVAVALLLLLMPRRRRKNKGFDWTKRHNWWTRWRARSAFSNDR